MPFFERDAVGLAAREEGAYRWARERTAGCGEAGVLLGSGVARGQDAGGLAGVPHSAQNFAVADRLALQFVQCFCMGVPHSAQNFEPTATWLWQLEHSAVPAGAGA
jgi:hypothetical protein